MDLDSRALALSSPAPGQESDHDRGYHSDRAHHGRGADRFSGLVEGILEFTGLRLYGVTVDHGDVFEWEAARMMTAATTSATTAPIT